MDLKPGDKAPAFKLPTDGGGTISLAALKGRPFVLYFYPKDNTSGCTREAVDFTKLAKKFEAIGVTVVGVSKDDTASHDRFKSKHKLKLTLASDTETKLAQASESGSKRACMAANSWAWSARPFWSIRPGKSAKSGER